jgi:hypothetical protein
MVLPSSSNGLIKSISIKQEKFRQHSAPGQEAESPRVTPPSSCRWCGKVVPSTCTGAVSMRNFAPRPADSLHSSQSEKFDVDKKNGIVAPMSKLLTKTLAFTLFAIFLMNMAAWGFSSHRLAHEIEHSRQFAPMMLALEHGDSYRNEVLDADDDGTPGASEHQFLHAVDHLQLFPMTVFYGTHPSLPSTVLPHFIFRTLPLATLDPPFRPPRSISFLA